MQENLTAYTGASEQQLAYIRAFRLMDDDYMAKFFEDNKECTEFVLKIIMDNPGLRVESVHSQHEFITERDELGAYLPIYHIDRTIRETGEPFGDGSHIIYVNGACKDDTPLGILMHDFMCSDPEEMKYKVLADRARYLKGSKEGIQSMCRAMEELAKNVRIEAAQKLIRVEKLTYEEIALCQDLTVEEVKKLADKMLASTAV